MALTNVFLRAPQNFLCPFSIASSTRYEIIIFRRKSFGRKIFNSVVGVFYSFSWKCPWRAECKPAKLVSRKIQVSSVTAVRKPEVVGSNPAIDHILYVFLETR